MPAIDPRPKRTPVRKYVRRTLTMAVSNSKGTAMPAKTKTAPVTAMIVEEADERPVNKRKSKTNPEAVAAITAALSTLTNGESRPYRISGDGAATFLGQLRRVAAEHNMRLRSAPSAQVEGAIVWQVIDAPPVKRNRTKKAEA